MTMVMKNNKDRQRKLIFGTVRKQIIKHDSRYLHGSNLVRAMYTELAIAKITIRILTKSTPLDSELITNYFSKVHNTTINLQDMYQFYQQHVTSEMINKIKLNVVYEVHFNNAQQIIDHNIDIWNNRSPQSKIIRKFAMMSYGAHPSTNHKKERLVKVAASTVQGGKQEMAANYYFMAMNGFSVDDNSYQDTNNQHGTKRKRNQKTATTKLKELVDTVDNKLILYARAQSVSPNITEFNSKKRWVRNKLKSKTYNIKINEEKDNFENMMDKKDEVITNSRTIFTGEYVPPIFDGYLDINKFCSGKMVAQTNYVEMEFSKRDMKTEYDNNKNRVNTLKLLLRQHELQRFENEVTVELHNQDANIVLTQSATLTSKLLILKESMDTNNVSDDMWNKFAVDVKKYFKLQSTEFGFDDVVDFW